jgi:hypothetical protein
MISPISRVALFLLIATTATAAQRYAGRPLLEALHDLETHGLRLVYSDDVVTSEMIVKSEPQATEPRRVLDELLREHRLKATRGPHGALLIVRSPEEEKREERTPRSLMPVTLAQIVVTPSRFQLLGSEPEQRQFLSREDVRRVPHVSDDFYRAIRRIPGAASDDLTARFSIRGGEEDEAVVLLDGAEIYDPFHLKDLIRLFSIIDVEAIGSVDILTGGFPAEYGGRMSGVIDMTSASPTKTKTEVGVSLFHLRALSEGTMANGRGEWLLSIRRGYLQYLIALTDSEDSSDEFDPRYSDLLGKFQWTLNAKNVLSGHVLASSDNLRFEESPGGGDDRVKANYRDATLWLNLSSSPTERLLIQSVAQYGTAKRDRRGNFTDGDQSAAFLDRRDFDHTALRTDASFDLTPRNLLKGGLSAKRWNARYDYDAEGITRTFLDPQAGPRPILRSVHLGLSSTEVAAYAADRFRVGERLVVEAGVRWGTESHTPDGAHISPRLNAAYTFSERTALRAAWGWFHQPQGAYELQAEDGVTKFSPAQRAEHRVIGVDHLFGRRITTRVEVYDKVITDPRPRFENLFEGFIAFPELRADRVRIAPRRSTARGIEVLLRKDSDGPLSGQLNLTHATVTDEIGGRDVPRAWDQRNAMTFFVNYRAGEHWNFNVAGSWHTGLPTTPLLAQRRAGRYEFELGPLRSERLPAYKRVDFRASRRAVTSRGAFTLFLDLFNAFNLSNVDSIDGFDFVSKSDGSVEARPVMKANGSILPSFGISWQF